MTLLFVFYAIWLYFVLLAVLQSLLGDFTLSDLSSLSLKKLFSLEISRNAKELHYLIAYDFCADYVHVSPFQITVIRHKSRIPPSRLQFIRKNSKYGTFLQFPLWCNLFLCWYCTWEALQGHREISLPEKISFHVLRLLHKAFLYQCSEKFYMKGIKKKKKNYDSSLSPCVSLNIFVLLLKGDL